MIYRFECKLTLRFLVNFLGRLFLDDAFLAGSSFLMAINKCAVFSWNFKLAASQAG
jgi:hypothetical protein